MIAILGGCARSDWRTEGKFWQQPAAKAGLKSLSPQIAVAGQTAVTSVHGLNARFGDWIETGGPALDRQGHTALHGVWPERGRIGGENAAIPPYGTHTELSPPTSTAERTMSTGGYTETAAEIGVAR